jgi:polyphenol oxidase
MLPAWTDRNGVNMRAGFMGRRGGVSLGPYASFNLAHWTGDNAAAVAENWHRWHALNPGLRPVMLSQVHGAKVLRARTGDSILDGERPAADGMVTTDFGLALCVFSADCVPILLCDEAAPAVAALHAGWRGTLAGIAGEGVRAMHKAGAEPKRIRAALGPAIDRCCFEVDIELADEFIRRLPFAAGFRRDGTSRKAFLDLRGIIKGQLQQAGLDAAMITNVGPCTRCNSQDYFSRRASGGTITGLQMSFIALSQPDNG